MITMKDIARRAGVSVVTVSRVLNGKYPKKVGEATRSKVLKIVEELGYQPNVSARALREQRTYQFGLVVPMVDGSFVPGVVQGLQDVAMDLGYSSLLYVTKSQPELELQIFRALLGKNVDGVIWVPGPVRDPEVDRIARDLPVVQLLYKEVEGLPALLVDQVHGAYLATRHLLDLGHRRVGNLAGNDRHGRQRLVGYYKALEESGVEPRPELVQTVPTNWEGARSATQTLFARGPDERPTGIVCYSDLVAWGALRAAQENRLAVPDELSLVGFDDVDFIQYVEIPMTTIAQPKQDLGALALKTMVNVVKGDMVEDHVLVPTLVTRSSTASPHFSEGVS